MQKILEQDRWQEEETVKPVARMQPPGSSARLSSPKSAALCPGQSDDEIIERIRNGDINAFDVLVQRYDRWVRGIVARRVTNGQVAEIVQEVFIQTFQSLPRHRPNTSFKGCLATIALRRCCDYWRAKNRQPTRAFSNLNAEDTELMEQSLQDMAREASQSEMERKRMKETLLSAMEQLDADDQIILGLLYWKNYSVEEIAAVLGCSPGNVRVRSNRARDALRKLMMPTAIAEQAPTPVNACQAKGMIYQAEGMIYQARNMTAVH